jgi:hypothetical protein
MLTDVLHVNLDRLGASISEYSRPNVHRKHDFAQRSLRVAPRQKRKRVGQPRQAPVQTNGLSFEYVFRPNTGDNTSQVTTQIAPN